MQHILIIDDDRDFRFLLKQQLKETGFNCHECGTSERAFEILATEEVDLVLCDLNLRKESARDIVIAMKEDYATIPVIIITGYSNVRTAVELIRLGAIDYLLKPLNHKELAILIRNIISGDVPRTEAGTSVTATSDRTAPHSAPVHVFSDNETSRNMMKQIELVAPTNFSVIIYGESGSGKEAYAQAIHTKSKRNRSPFLAIDCGALSKELSASILFGHEKGAFTGAIGTKEGAFETAHGGTVFLDEVTNLPLEIQVSLLRVMQERKTRRVGGTKDIPIDVRIIVASNIKLWDACRDGKFREDLYHRFNEFTIDIIPLRERKDDILFYGEHFIKESNKELRKAVRGFTEEATDILMKYRWSGNVRELRNVVRRSMLITETDTIGRDSLPEEVLMETYNADYDSLTGPKVPFVPVTENSDYPQIVEAMRRTLFDKKKAGKMIGLDVKTMNAKIRAHNHDS